MLRFLCYHALVGVVTLWFVAAPQTMANNWTDGNGNWNVAGNWSGGVPGVGQTVNIVNTDGTARTVTLNVSTPSLALTSIDLTGAGAAANSLSMSNNFNFTSSALFVGGYNGTGPTNGRGAMTQSAGTVTMNSGTDIVLGYGAGSTGTYTLSGTGELVARQSLFLGFNGAGTFNHSAGKNTISFSTVGSLSVGTYAGSNGTYNLSGTGELVTLKSQYIGDQGTGTFTQTGGSNRLTNAFLDDLYIGNSAGSVGTYNMSGGEFYNAGNVTVGVNGTGTLNISGTANFQSGSGAYYLTLGNNGHLNITGGKLRFSNFSKAASATLSYTAGAIQMPGDRTLNSNFSDATLNTFFPPDSTPNSRTISSGKELIVEGATRITDLTAVAVNGGKLTSQGVMEIGLPGPSLEYSHLFVVNGSTATVAQATIGAAGKNAELLLTNNSTFRATNGIQMGGANSSVVFQIYDSLVDAGSSLSIGEGTLAHIENSTLRFNSYFRSSYATLEFLSGEIQLVGNRTIGSDAAVKEFFGITPTLSRGKSLVVEGIATLTTPLLIDRGTFKTNSLVVGTGGALDFNRGVLEVDGGVIQGMSELVVPTNGEFRGRSAQSLRIVGATGSTMTATGNWAIGDDAALNGFYTNGTLNTGRYSVTLWDANDAVLDSGALVTIGNGGNSGTLDAPKGLTLDFGGNIQGFGSITTPNSAAMPFINNGHIAGTGGVLTLSGYVKGVGTLTNVTITGTLAPGLSPTSLQVGNVALSNTSTLLMEIGGTSPGSSYDQLISSGALALDGTLKVSLFNGFAPIAGQSFNLFDWNSVSGAFQSLQLPTLAGLIWNTSQLYSDGILSLAAAGLTGDYNQDGVVDAADYVVWRKNPGGFAADAFTTWRSHFGQPPGSGASATANAAVPEPTTLVLVLVGTLALLSRRRNAVS